MAYWRLSAFLAACTMMAGLTVASATPLEPQSSPTILPLAVTPATVLPGQTVHVSASGLSGLPITGQTACLGILGPGQNVELDRSPSFRPQIGTLTVSASGDGQANASVPSDLVVGSYRLILGPCSPHGAIAPLSTIAQATIVIAGTSGGVAALPTLPATGGVPTDVMEAILAIGAVAVALGFFLRRRR